MIRLLRTAALVTIFCVDAYGQHPSVQQYRPSEETVLKLVASDDRCMLKWIAGDSSGKVPTGLSYPCHFHVDKNGQVREKTIRNECRLLIEKSHPVSAHPSDCQTNIRGVVVSPAVVSLSRHAISVASCPPFQWDEKMFIGLFD